MSNLPSPYVMLENQPAIQVTPYSADPSEIIERLGISLPFKIVEKTDGTSTCESCKQVYSGYQLTCEKLVPAYKYKSTSWSYVCEEKGNRSRGETFIKNGYDILCVDGNHWVPCRGYCTWSLSNEFSKQTSFFNELEYLSSGGSFKLYNILPYVTNHKELDRVEKSILHNRVENLELLSQRFEMAIKVIAEKMNQAGSNLMF